jgi:hypothetical protein
VKFTEYWNQAPALVGTTKLLLVGGDDDFFKDQVRVDFIGRHSQLTCEFFVVSKVRELVAGLERGSLFGPCLVDVFFRGRVENSDEWLRLFALVNTSVHTMVVVFKEKSDLWNDSTLDVYPEIAWVECSYPKVLKERKQVINTLLDQRKIVLGDAKFVDEIAKLSMTSTELDNVVNCLDYLKNHHTTISLKDMRLALSLWALKSILNSQDLLSGNLFKLNESIDGAEPLELLSYWSQVLRGFYIWLCHETPTVQLESSDSEEETESGDSLTYYRLKLYRLAKGRYSLALVREVLESFNAIDQDCRLGQSYDWRERTRMVIQKLAIKA